MSELNNEHVASFACVNKQVSWQARVFNRLVLRGIVKPKIIKLADRTLDIPVLRSLASKLDTLISGKLAGVIAEKKEIDGIRCSWLTQVKPTERVLLYLHGGGFCIHLPKTYDAFVARLAIRLNANALIPDYRLVPENPFPAGVNDCFTCYRWLLSQGFKAGNIIVAGDSAGGCLTLTTLIQIRMAKLAQPAAAILMSPATELSENGFNFVNQENQDPLFTISALHRIAECYTDEDVNDSDPLFSPLNDSLANLAPLQFHVGSSELLLNHSTDAFNKAKQAGNEAEINYWQEMPHVHALITWLPESKKAIEMMCSFAEHHLQNTGNSQSKVESDRE